MDPTNRTSWKIWTIGATTLTALFLASSVAANDSHHSHPGERINRHLDFAAAIAALSGDPYLAAELDRKGDLIEHYVDGHRDGYVGGDRSHHGYRDHEYGRWQRRVGSHHRHFNGCGHSRLSRRWNHGRHSWRRSHDVDRHFRGHKRHHRRQNKKYRRNHRH